MQSNSYFIPLLEEFLKHFDIRSDRKDLQLLLQSSPSFPSVLSIIQTCVYFGLNTKAYKADYDVLLKNNMPVLVHLKEDSDEKFVLVNKVTDKCVIYRDATTLKTIKTSVEDFSAKWTGILILSESNEVEKSPKKKISLKKHGIVALFLIAILTILLYDIQNIGVFSVVTFVLKCAGIWLTFNLIRHEKGISNTLSDEFCRKTTAFDCDKVLASGASRIFNTVSLADIGFVYFVTGLAALVLSVFSSGQNTILSILFYLSVCATPFILFSVLYQKIVVKKWCPLCLSVIGVIFLEICLFLFYPDKFPIRGYVQPFILLSFSFTVGIIIVYVLKRLLQEQQNALTNKIERLRMKRSPLILATVFSRQQQTLIPQKHPIIIGNQQAPVVITTLLNPMCRPCAKTVRSITSLMDKYPQSLLWQLRFDGIESDEYHPINQIQLHLMQLCNNKTDDVKLQIISDWYHKQSVQRFTKKYSFKEITKQTLLDFAKQNAENKLLNVRKIPTMWINNREFPEEYSVDDIPFLLTDVNLLLKLTK